jgi:WD40 repeat protein/serine/threonine protein kinase
MSSSNDDRPSVDQSGLHGVQASLPGGDTSDDRNPVEALAEEFADRLRNGEHPTLAEYLQKYPQHADEIRELFPALVAMEQLKPAGGDLTDSFAGNGFRPSVIAHPKRLGDYRILREVGRGGMGVVYEAEQESLGRHVALKVLPASALLDARQLHRFEREARSAARLHHTNIVPVYGVGETDGLHYYVMQFIQGLGLDQVFDELRRLRGGADVLPTRGADSARLSAAAHSLLTGHFANPAADLADSTDDDDTAVPGPAPTATSGSSSTIHLPGHPEHSSLSETGRHYYQSVARIGIQVADALSYAHGLGTLHRDIKPSNLLLDAQGIVWVTDFGLAKASDSGDLTADGEVVGTLRYIPPERFKGHSDARGDIYSLGLTLYELLTLRTGFAGEGRHQMIERILHEEPPRPRQVDPSLPRDLETIVLKAIAKDPSQRYRNAAELADDLKRFVEDRPIHARRVSTTERFARWCRRNPMIAGLSAAVAGLLLAVAVVGGIGKWRADREAAQAQRARDDAETARAEAERARDDAEANFAANRKLLGEQYVTHGTRLLEKGDLSGALVWFTEALKRDQDDPQRSDEHRRRIGALLRQCPRPARLFFHPGIISAVDFSPDGRWIVTAGADGHAQVWDAVTGEASGEPLAHTGPISSLWFRPDGRLFTISGTQSKTPPPPAGEAMVGSGMEIRIWDLATRHCVVLPMHSSVGYPFFTADFRHLLSMTDNLAVKVLDTLSDDQVGSVIAMDRPISRAMLAGDGSRVITTATEDSSLHLWNVKTGQEIPLNPPLSAVSVGRGRGGYVTNAANVSRSGDLLVGNLWDRGLQVWDVGTGKSMFTFAVPGEQCNSVHFSEDGGHLLANFVRSNLPINSSRLHILRTDTGKPAGPPIDYELSLGQNAVLSPDGRRLAGLNREGGLQVWSVATGRPLTFSMRHEGPLQSWRFSPDGRYLLVASADNAVRVWEAGTGQPVTPVLKHDRAVTEMRVSPDGSRFLTVSGNAARLWTVGAPSAARAILSHEHDVGQFQMSADGSRVLTVTSEAISSGIGMRYTAEVRVWDASDGRLIAPPRRITNSPPFFNAAFSPDGRHVLLSNSMRQLGAPAAPLVQIWDIETDSLTALEVPNIVTLTATFSEDGRSICMTADPNPNSPGGGGVFGPGALPGAPEEPPPQDIEVRRYDATTGKPVGPTIKYPGATRRNGPGGGGAGGFGSASRSPSVWSRDGTRFAAAVKQGSGTFVRIWDTGSAAEIMAPLHHEGTADRIGIEFSDDGLRLLATIYQPRTNKTQVRIWDLPSRSLAGQLPDLVLGNMGLGNSNLRLSPDGTRLLTFVSEPSGNARVRLFDVPSGQFLSTPLTDEWGVVSAEFSTDGRRIVTAGSSGAVRVWDAATGEPRTPVLDCGGPGVVVRFSRDGRRLLASRLVGNGSVRGGGPGGARTSITEVRVWDAVTGQPLSPPLRSTGPSSYAVSRSNRSRFNALGGEVIASDDGDRVLLADDRNVLVCDMSAENRPVEELLPLTQLLACRKVNQAGSLQVIEEGGFEAGWNARHVRNGDDPGGTAPSGAAWHHRQARECGFDDDATRIRFPGSSVEGARSEAFTAVWHLDRLVDAEPNDPYHRSARGNAQIVLHQWDRAVDDFTRAIDGNVPNLWTSRAQAHAELGHWKEAEADYVRAVEAAGEIGRSPLALASMQFPLALVRLKLGDEEGFRTVCAEMLKRLLDSPSASPFPVSGTYYAFTLFVLIPRAVPDPRQVVTLQENQRARSFANSSRGAVFYRAGMDDEALREFGELLADETAGSPADWFFLAMTQHRKGQKEKAQRSLERGIERMEAIERIRDDDDEPARSSRFGRLGTSFFGSGTNGWQERIMNQVLRHEAEEELKRN